jgi:hypothetical protein
VSPRELGRAEAGSAAGAEPASRLRVLPLGRERLEAHLAEAVAIDARAREELGDAYSHESWSEQHFRAERPGKWELSRAALRADRLVGFVIASRDGAA